MHGCVQLPLDGPFGQSERIGDLAKNVAKRVVAIGEQSASVKVAASLAPLAERVRAILRTALSSNVM